MKMAAKIYLNDFKYWNGSEYITFNILNFNAKNKSVRVAITNAGQIIVTDFDLKEDKMGLYFEYGPVFDKINLTEFCDSEELLEDIERCYDSNLNMVDWWELIEMQIDKEKENERL